MFAIIASVLIFLWLVGLLAFHVTSTLIDIVLIVALIFFVLHLISGKAQARTHL
jgi:hypothetical protein